ncbi:hypothetical protein GCM10010182_18320 [Actinomadura cremea]|nr:hypothetical protein GCM10010182_18320 [Actinomadura cremea]
MATRKRRRTERWAAASARRGPLGAWAATRLFAAASTGDADARDGIIRVAGLPEHRLTGWAKEVLAGWWCDTRDPEYRAAVLATGAVAMALPARLRTLALHDRLDAWDEGEADWAPVLLADADPDVRERAAEHCRTATGPMLAALWDVCAGLETPLGAALLAGDAPPPGPGLDALWHVWLDDPERRTGDALLRWATPATGGHRAALTVVAVATDTAVLLKRPNRAALLDALFLDGHPLRAIAVEKFLALNERRLVDDLCTRALTDARAAGFCAEHGLAPADPARRALYFMATGRPEQQHALDPDGSLLSLAYAAAPEDERALVRDAMLAAGELDLVRVIVGDDRRARIPEMPPGEIRYLAEQLARRREWDDLWSLLQDLSVTACVELVRLFDRWTPRGDDERRLFALLRESDPELVEAGAERLRQEPVQAEPQASYLFQGRVNDVSFAPDGPYLAVAGMTKAAGVFDLRTAELTERYEGFGASVGSVLHLGNGTLVAGEHPDHGQAQCRILRCVNGGTRVLHTASGAADCLTLTGDGAFAAGTRDGTLLFGGPDGRVEARGVASFGLGRGQWPRRLAAHRGAAPLAMLGRSVHLLDRAAGHARPVHPRSTTARIAFADSGALVCAEHDGTLTRVPLDGGRAAPRHRAKVPGFAGLGVLPRTRRVVVADGRGALHFLDGERLAPVGVHTSPRTGKPSGLTVSPDGDLLAVGHRDGAIDLFDLRLLEVPALVRRPMSSFLPRHLGLVAAACADPAADARTRRTLGLLRACLEHRFRFDVELGESVALAGGEHDISL